MKRHSFFKYVLAAAALLISAGCHEDKGNYEYHDINTIEVEGLEAYYQFSVGQPVTIRPEIKQTIPATEENLSYLWLRYARGTVPLDTVWREKYMDDIVPNLPVARNTLVYKVTDNTTGVSHYSEPFEIEIFNDINKGFLLLSDNGGKTELRHINYSGYTPANQNLDGRFEMKVVDLSAMPELGRPYEIACYDDYSNAPSLGGDNNVSIVAIRFATETGLYSLRRSDMHYEDLYNGSYLLFGEVADLRVRRIFPAASLGQWSCMLMDQNDNYLMYRFSNPSALQYWTGGTYTNSYPQSGTLEKVFPALPPPAMAFNMYGEGEAYAGVVLYDTESKSLVYRYGSVTQFCSKYDAGKETMFRFNNTDFTPRFIYYRPQNEDGDTPRAVYSIVKQNDANEMYLLKWQIDNGTQFFKQRLYPTTEADKTMPGIMDAEIFAMGTPSVAEQRPFIYYAVGGKVYVYNYYDQGVTEVWSAPAGNTITQMRVLDTMTSRLVTASCPFQNHLVIMSDAADGTSTMEVCKIVDTYGTLTLGEAGPEGGKQQMRWPGLPKVVSFAWKIL